MKEFVIFHSEDNNLRAIHLRAFRDNYFTLGHSSISLSFVFLSYCHVVSPVQ